MIIKIVTQVLTKDSVTVSVDAVVYYRVSNATISVANVEDAHSSTRWVRMEERPKVYQVRPISTDFIELLNFFVFMQFIY